MINYLWTIVLAWIILMRIMRYFRHRAIENEKDCEKVYKTLFSVEFPFLWLKGLELALFNTFPYLPVFSRLSINKKFTKEPELRYDDTELLLREAWEHGLDSERGKMAMQRLNFIHKHFNIDNRSYLYVLALFVVTPVRLINEFEFRRLTKHEINSTCRAITKMGKAMNIKDLPITFSDYEKIVDDEYMGPRMKLDEKCRGRIIADSVMKMFLHPFPTFIHGLAKKIIYALLDEPIRQSLGYPKQPKFYRYLAKGILLLRAYTIALFFPIRPMRWAILRTPDVAGGSPKYQKYRKPGCPFSYEHGYNIDELGVWNGDGIGCPIAKGIK